MINWVLRQVSIVTITWGSTEILMGDETITFND